MALDPYGSGKCRFCIVTWARDVPIRRTATALLHFHHPWRSCNLLEQCRSNCRSLHGCNLLEQCRSNCRGAKTRPCTTKTLTHQSFPKATGLHSSGSVRIACTRTLNCYSACEKKYSRCPAGLSTTCVRLHRIFSTTGSSGTTPD